MVIRYVRTFRYVYKPTGIIIFCRRAQTSLAEYTKQNIGPIPLKKENSNKITSIIVSKI